jgi:hypothetical protein
MFKNKGAKPTKKRVLVKPKVLNPSVHMVDGNMAINKNKVTQKHVFKEKERIKKKSTYNWEEEQRLQ